MGAQAVQEAPADLLLQALAILPALEGMVLLE
jgi:hypothetical protein